MAATSQIALFHAPRAVFDTRAMTRYCRDCAVDVVEIGEWYMVRDDVWPIEDDGGALCIGCLEQRIGRQLVARDFTDAPVNAIGAKSSRMHARMQARGEA